MGLNCSSTLFLNGYPTALVESKSFILERELTMSIPSVLSSKFADKGEPNYDPNRIVTINLKASEAYILRFISAILADERCTEEARKSILWGCKATPQDMMKIHHKIYYDEMGWRHYDLDK